MNRDAVIQEHWRKNYKPLVKHITNRVPHNSLHIAEEVVQEAYAKVLRHWKAYNPERGEFSTWFNRILNNTCSDVIAQENGTWLSFDNDEMDLEPFILNENRTIPREVVMRVQKAIEEQTPEKREVLHMFFNLGMKATDIADCTAFSYDSVRKLVSRWRIEWNDENIF